MSDRYEGKPFIRLVDCYVLDAIGHLDDAQEAQLIEMTPDAGTDLDLDLRAGHRAPGMSLRHHQTQSQQVHFRRVIHRVVHRFIHSPRAGQRRLVAC